LSSRVARLNLIDGQASFQPASLDTSMAATLNSQTNFGFLNLDDRTVQMRFTEGRMEVRLRALSDDDLDEIDTPNGAVSLLRSGDYRD
jgi:hypothetical protein